MKPRESISRKPIVLLASVCIIVSAVAIPVAAKLPRLVEVELVMAVWWLVWVGILTYLLHRGHEVEDDAMWDGVDVPRTKAVLKQLDWSTDSGCAIASCGEFGLILLAIVLLFAALAMVVELVVPAIALLLLASIGGMFARAVNDTHHCEGRLGLSLLWGAAWATVYVGPVAAIAIWVAAYLAKRG